jgi:prefoldin subunit 5
MSQAKPEVDPQELARFAARISEHLQELEASVDQWREYRNDYQQLGHLLSTLPEKTSYDIMVCV